MFRRFLQIPRFFFFLVLCQTGESNLFGNFRCVLAGVAINTFCQAISVFSHSHTHIPRWGGCEDALPLRGPLRSASIFLAWLVGPLPPGAQGSSPHIGLGPSPCNMSGIRSILRPWRPFFGHECGRSLRSIQTSCGTRNVTRSYASEKQLKDWMHEIFFFFFFCI